MTGWERWSTGNCARNWNLTIRINSISQSSIYPGKWDTKTRFYNNQQKKRGNLQNCGLYYSGWPQSKMESEKKDKYFDLARELKKTVEHESDDYINCNLCSWYSHQRIDTRTGGLENNRTSGDHPNYCIIEISQNTEESPRDLRRFVVIQTPEKDYQLTLMWKTLKD